MKPAQMMVTDAQGSMVADLLLDFETGLLGICVLNIPVHRREVDQRDQRHDAAQDVRKCGRPGLSRGEGHPDLTEVIEVGRVAGGQERIREGAQRHSIVEEPEAAADYRAAANQTATTRIPGGAKSCLYPLKWFRETADRTATLRSGSDRGLIFHSSWA